MSYFLITLINTPKSAALIGLEERPCFICITWEDICPKVKYCLKGKNTAWIWFFSSVSINFWGLPSNLAQSKHELIYVYYIFPLLSLVHINNTLHFHICCPSCFAIYTFLTQDCYILVICVVPGVEFDDHYGFLPTQDTLRFYDIIIAMIPLRKPIKFHQ